MREHYWENQGDWVSQELTNCSGHTQITITEHIRQKNSLHNYDDTYFGYHTETKSDA